MGGFSIWHWLIVLAVILIVFGAGKLPRVMGDVAKGIKNFKQGMQDDKPEEIQAQAAPPAAPQPANAQSTQPGAAQKVS
ncbi:MAG: twin-arginine translocase TatA/TatE family subunit [Alphaproteobacteria bacterium]